MYELTENIIYVTDHAGAAEIAQHLRACDADFIPQLSKKTDIGLYSEKLAGNSVTFEARKNGLLAGLVAAYMNDEKKQSAFITSVSVLKDFAGKGIAAQLILNCAAHGTDMGFEEILLEVSPQNMPALKLYERNGFKKAGMNKDMMIMKKKLK